MKLKLSLKCSINVLRERKSTLVDNIVNGGELNNPVDDSVLNIFSKSQNSSSIRRAVYGQHIFLDDLLCYSFVVGSRGEIRETLELWAPRTLHEAIYQSVC